MIRLLLALACWFAGPAQAVETLYLYNWNNYISDKTVARFEARCGCRVVLDSQRELMAAAMLYLGYDINDTDEAKWQRARDLILGACRT